MLNYYSVTHMHQRIRKYDVILSLKTTPTYIHSAYTVRLNLTRQGSVLIK